MPGSAALLPCHDSNFLFTVPSCTLKIMESGVSLRRSLSRPPCFECSLTSAGGGSVYSLCGFTSMVPATLFVLVVCVGSVKLTLIG